ncbi:hypothetical protein [Onishia taeanensis]|uniref:hypothetical protein n=1 Tax=Onishia taeanensis TaxID=284577 RepID=UPI003C7A5355
MAAHWVDAGRLRELDLPGCRFSTPFVTITRRDRRPHRVLEAFLDELANQS